MIESLVPRGRLSVVIPGPDVEQPPLLIYCRSIHTAAPAGANFMVPAELRP